MRWIFLVFVMVAGGTGALVWQKPELMSLGAAVAVPGSRIPSRPLERRDIVRRVRAIGVVMARESRIANAPFSGKITKLAPEGSLVDKGDPVVWMETTEIETEISDLELELSSAESELERAEEEQSLLKLEGELTLEAQRAQVGFAQTRAADARRSLEEQRLLVERQIAAPSTLEDERLKLLQADLSLREAKIDLKKAEEKQASDLRLKEVEIQRARLNKKKREDELKRERAKLEKAVLEAPGAGFVSMLYTWRGGRVKISEGDEVWEGAGVMEIPDSTQMTASVPINELDINKIEIGQKAVVRAAAIPDEAFPGKVAKKGSVPLTRESAEHFTLPADGVKLFEVGIDFEEQDPRFRQHMTAFVEIEAGRAENVLAAPLDAIFKGSEKGTWRVLVRDPDSKTPREVMVTLGVEDENFAEIKTSDPPLEEGMELLFRDPAQPLPRNL